MTDVTDIRRRIVAIGVPQGRVAGLAGYDYSAFSRILSGSRRPPEGFIEHVTATLDVLEEAEQAAEAARQRVLAEHAVRRRPQRHERRKGTGESPARIRALAS